MKKVLGLDIGVSSVGWGIIDEDTGEIIDAGVRLFEEATRNGNEERRSFRGARRLKRRRTHRLERAKELFEKTGLPTSKIGVVDPYSARYNAIFGEVSKEELVAGLYHLVKRRGTTIDSPEEDIKSGNELSTKEQLSRNKKLLENKYICEIQLGRLENKHEKMRNYENRFRTEDYVKEAKAILNKQKKIYEEITDDFIEKFIDLIEKRRQYYDGPGSDKSPTPYGRYYIGKDGRLVEVSMIDKMRGKCTYYPEELRIAKMSFTADLFNLLSGDLSKLQVNGEYLTYEDKLYLVNNFIKKGRNITLKQIMKYKGVTDEADVKGYRVDLKNDQPAFTEFTGYKKIKKIVEEHSLPLNMLDDIDLLDDIADILTAEKSYERRIVKFKKVLERKYEDSQINKIIEALKENTDFKGYHSLSKKLINSILEELWYTNKNQMQIFTERGLEKKRLESNVNQKNIKFDDDAILSTVAKRAHREAIKIVNVVRKKYGELDSIVVETAREKNREEERRQYSEFQRKIGKHEKAMAKLLGVSSLKELKLNSKQLLALKLLVSQDYKCIYSGKSIAIHDIVHDFSKFEIDHILPLSLSFDDSQANKVLCLHGENQRKGQMTPYQYFTSGKASRSFEQFKVEALNLYKSKRITSKKKDYLLELRNIKHNEELQKEFINRNLVDTQYAMRSFSMTLRTFFKANEIDTKVFAIRGSFTAALRRNARMKKDRDESYAHHAIDALIVAAIGRMPVFNFYKEFDMTEEGVVFNKETGEIMDNDDFFSNSFITFLRNLMNYESKVKYSHKVDRKVNRTMSKLTLFSTREKEGEKYLLDRTSNIYFLNKNDNELNSIIKRLNTKPESFLMFQQNPEVINLLQKIIEEYRGKDNPFRAYYDDHGYVMKDGKVPVKRLKFFSDRLGNHMDVTQKYPDTKNDLVLLSVKTIRVDIYKNAEGKYKYLGIPYYWFKQQGNQYVLDMKKYCEEKSKEYKKIDSTYEFQFSLYKNDRFSFEKKGEYYEWIFRGDNNPRQNKIEVEFIHRKKKKEERSKGMLAPSTFNNVMKYNVDILGNTYKIGKENFKSYLQL